MLIGGHIDSVPNGGWLDGCLNVVAGVEVLRRIAEEGEPPVTVRLVNWADEEGARFGRSLFGSSAAAGSMSDQDDLRQRATRRRLAPGRARGDGVDLDRALDARPQLESAAAYLELHIEQGPVLESLGLPLGVVLGTFGVERQQITWAARPPTPARRRWTSGATRSPARPSSPSRSATIAARSGTAPSAPPAASSRSPASSRRSSRRPSSCSTSGTSTRRARRAAAAAQEARALRARGRRRGRVGPDLEHRADPVRRRADRARRRGDPRGRRARRTACRAARCTTPRRSRAPACRR